MSTAEPEALVSDASLSDTPAPIFLMGATACGKTALSVRLANALDAEIISVDSALVYRGMDIGTAKPTVREREGITHHLIDVCEPWHSYSAAEFCNDASALVDDIHQRGKRSLLVGGTMLYFKALEEGLAELPEADAKVRKKIEQEAALQGWQALHDQLRSVDPEAAARIHPNDPQRLQRALEVYRVTGMALSELQKRTQSYLTVPPVKFALIPKERAWLHQRIEQRFRQMVASGFLREMQSLREQTLLHAQLPAMRSVGYRQAWEYLESLEESEPLVEAIEVEWVDKAVAATRQLAKRQLTWLRSMSSVQIIECDTQSTDEQLESVLCALNLC